MRRSVRTRRPAAFGGGGPGGSDPFGPHDPDFIDKISPINYFDGVTGRCKSTGRWRHQPPRWACAIRELAAAGKDVTYFEYEGQGHALKGDAWRTFMQRTADFFAANL